jgi:hypothetical protein
VQTGGTEGLLPRSGLPNGTLPDGTLIYLLLQSRTTDQRTVQGLQLSSETPIAKLRSKAIYNTVKGFMLNVAITMLFLVTILTTITTIIFFLSPPSLSASALSLYLLPSHPVLLLFNSIIIVTALLLIFSFCFSSVLCM